MPTGTVGGKTMGNEEYKKLQETLNKPWAEATVEEKLEKVRDELTQLGYLMGRLSNIELEVSKLKKHSHQDGKLVIPLEDNLFSVGQSLQASRRNNLA